MLLYFYGFILSPTSYSVNTEIYIQEFTKEKAANSNISDDDLKFIAFFYTGGLLGIIEKWLESGMTEDFDDIIDKTGFLFDRNITHAIDLILKT